MDRESAKTCISFLGQPMGKSLHAKLRDAYGAWTETRDDKALVAEVGELAKQFGKEKAEPASGKRLTRDDLKLICYEYVSS